MKLSPGKLIRGILTKFSKNNDVKTTVIGAVLVAILAANNIDFNKILLGDKEGLVDLAVISLLAVFAFFTNKAEKDKSK